MDEEASRRSGRGGQDRAAAVAEVLSAIYEAGFPGLVMGSEGRGHMTPLSAWMGMSKRK